MASTLALSYDFLRYYLAHFDDTMILATAAGISLMRADISGFWRKKRLLLQLSGVYTMVSRRWRSASQ